MSHRIAVGSNRNVSGVASSLLASMFLCAACGCLSIGGKTEVVRSSPESEARISSLETRVGMLEQNAGIRSSGGPSGFMSEQLSPPVEIKGR